MSTRKSNLVLLSSAVVMSHVLILIGSIARKFFAVSFHVRSTDELNLLMPKVSQLASDYSWVFALMFAMIVAVASFSSMRRPEKNFKLLVMALCAQAFVFWIAMFCFCYDGFLGTSSLHHGPDFDISNFFQFGYGIFPVALIALLAPALAVIFGKEPNVS